MFFALNDEESLGEAEHNHNEDYEELADTVETGDQQVHEDSGGLEGTEELEALEPGEQGQPRKTDFVVGA